MKVKVLKNVTKHQVVYISRSECRTKSQYKYW